MELSPDDPKWVIGFAGNGEVTEKVVAKLLTKHLPEGDEDVDGIYVPQKVARADRGLKEVVGWLSLEFGEDGFDNTDDLLRDLKQAKEDGFHVELITLLPDEPDEELEALAADALDAGLTVLDLCDGLDAVEIAPDEKTEEVKGEAKEEPETPRRRSRRGSTPEEPEASQGRRGRRKHPATEAQDKVNGDEGDTKPRGRRRGGAVEGTAEREAFKKDDPPWEEDGTRSPAKPEPVHAKAVLLPVGDELERLIDERIASHLESFARHIRSGGRGPGRPKADGSPPTPAAEAKISFYKDDDGNLTKRGRGRPRAGQTIVELTRKEAEEQGFEFED